MLPRERFAWAWLAGLVVVPGLYFLAVAVQAPTNDGGPLQRLVMLGVALVALAGVALAARFLGGAHSALAPGVRTDERDRHIESRSTTAAYHALMVGMIVVGFVMPFGASRWELVDAAFFSIVVAEVIHYGLVLRGYRKGYA